MGANRYRNIFLVSAALIAGIVLTGCGADSSTDSSSSKGDSAAGMAAPGQAKAPAQAQEQGPGDPAQAPDLSVDQRSIIYRGSISVRVKDVNGAAAQATGIAATAGGFIGSDNRSSGGTGKDTASIQLRVPADKFTSVVDQLAKLGQEATREINTEDVTEQTVDLGARIKVQQARVDSGRKLLAQAKTLNDLVMLEKEVATRESDLASLQAKQRKLADLTALSTITVSFLTPDAVVVPEDDSPPGFLAGLSAGWHSLLASLKVLLTVLGALLPWVIALALPIWGIVYLWRRFNISRRLGPPALAPAGPRLPHYPPSAAGPYAGQPPAAPAPADPDPADGDPPTTK